MPTLRPGPGTARGRVCVAGLGCRERVPQPAWPKQTFISGGRGGWEFGTQVSAGVVVALSAEACLLGCVLSLRLSVRVSS